MAVIGAIRTAGPGTLREIQARVNEQRAKELASVVDYQTMRTTLQHATRGKHPALLICGKTREPYAKCWLSIYDLADPQEPSLKPESSIAQACADLSAVVGIWSAVAPVHAPQAQELLETEQ